jgi:uncharacterized membrane protein YciS (DUF1049 family)/exopolysaccharide biosynthesis protein
MGLKKIPKKFYFLILIIIVLAISGWTLGLANQQKIKLNQKIADNQAQIEQLRQELTNLQNQDQIKINRELQKNIENIQTAYKKTVAVYEDLLLYKDHGGKNSKLDEALAKILSLLIKLDYQGAETNLASLSAQIKTENEKLVASVKIPENVPVANAPPSSGYRRQQVQTDAGTFMVSIISADLNSTRVIVDTASDSTCANNCPILPLADYVTRSGAFAGVNGSYFCPTEYPQCAGKTNSFDTLLMNKNKVYFNSDNNVYSTVPVVIFGGGWVRFEPQSLNWGRDTGVDGVIAMQPLLVHNRNLNFTPDSDAKHNVRGGRSFVANIGNTIYIGVVHSATVGEAAKVLFNLGMENALNLDDGGSVALWSGGYKVGPGRNIPNAVLFVRK